MYMQPVPFQSQPPLTPSQIADLRLAASKLSGPERRSFEAEMTLKYCQGNPLKAEAVFGWGRQTVALGLAEKRSGVICLGAQGRPVSSRWGGASPQALCTLDLERCPWCHPGTLGLIATIPYRPVIRKLLRPLKLAAGPPPIAPARLGQDHFT